MTRMAAPVSVTASQRNFNAGIGYWTMGLDAAACHMSRQVTLYTALVTLVSQTMKCVSLVRVVAIIKPGIPPFVSPQSDTRQA